MPKHLILTAVMKPTIEAISKSTNGFWEANFWGIVGTVSGLASLAINYLSLRNNKSAIYIDNLRLEYRKNYLKDKEKNIKAMISTLGFNTTFTLSLNVNNKSGGSGSISKPMLIIKDPENQQIICTCKPTTDRIHGSPGTSTEVADLGKVFNLKGEQKIMGYVIEYIIMDPEIMHVLAIKEFKFKYYIRYENNKGKSFEKEVKSVIPVD